jgi:hypothetical protein
MYRRIDRPLGPDNRMGASREPKAPPCRVDDSRIQRPAKPEALKPDESPYADAGTPERRPYASRSPTKHQSSPMFFRLSLGAFFLSRRVSIPTSGRYLRDRVHLRKCVGSGADMLTKRNPRRLLPVLLVAGGVWSTSTTSFGQQSTYGDWTSKSALARCLSVTAHADSGGYSFELKNDCDFRISFVYDACVQGPEGGPSCRIMSMGIDSNSSSGDLWNFGLPPRPREFRPF